MRRLVTAVGLGLALTLTTACGSEPQFSEYESEDCDFEDFQNREADCGFTDADRKKHKAKKASSKVTSKPASGSVSKPKAPPKPKAPAKPAKPPKKK